MTETNDPVEYPDPAPSDPEAIRSHIEHSRAELSDTVDQLSAKLNVKAQATDKIAAARSKLADRAVKAKASAPPPVQRAIDKAGEKTAPIVHRIGEKAEPHRSQLIAAGLGVVVLLLVVRRFRRGGDQS